MKEIPVAKIKMMKASIRCLGLGFLGLLPLIGPPFAFAGLWYSFRARRLEKERGLWNPAKTQRIAGLVCASIGALVWCGVDAVLIYNVCYNYVNS